MSTGADGRERRLPAVGAAIGRAVERSGRRVVLLASGATSHTFWKLRQPRAHEASDPSHIRTPEAREADLRAAGMAASGRARPRHRHDAGVPLLQAGGDVRPLPDDGGRHRRPRLHRPRPALQRRRELDRHRPGPRLVQSAQHGWTSDPSARSPSECPGARTLTRKSLGAARPLGLVRTWCCRRSGRVFRSLWKSSA